KMMSSLINQLLKRFVINDATLFPAARFYRARPRRSNSNRKPAWVIDTVLDIYANGSKSYRVTMHEFNRLYAHTGVTVCLSTVYAWVQKYRYEMEVVRSKTRNSIPEHRPANLRWCLDGTGKVDANGVQHFILGMVDHGTRLNLLLTRLESATSKSILEQLTATVKLFGKPKLIRTDNASVFRSTEFKRGISRLGIRHEFSQPGKPWQNGRIERFFLTLKQKLNLIVPKDGAALDNLLAEFATWYNVIRPHQHLHGLTPAEAWRGIDPYKIVP
ncbi:integrase core domain-containing protein, partial [Undibacterium sp. Ji42W]|uniref:integrase core domain-containing protein n=1 Tax=Undibacterium sp. Ji42W TaxID=3413039 RepID=UPI003BF3BC7D